MSDRKSPSGELTSVKGTIAIPATPVAAGAGATQTASFVLDLNGGRAPTVGNVVTLSPQANLTSGISVAWARIVSTGLVAIGFNNVGASTAQAAVTFDADSQLQ